MGGSTQVVPTTSNTQQKVEIPQYLQDAGALSVQKATDYSNTPYQPFTGQAVAPLSDNQKTASSLAASSTNAGMGFIDQARQILSGGNAALGRAGTIANDNATTGKDAGDYGASLARLAGTSATNDAGAGLDSADLSAALARLTGQTATNSIGTGVAEGQEGSRLAGLAGTSATNNQNAGADLVDLAGYKAAASGTAGNADLEDARGYNAKSAAPITAQDIYGYFNPYIQTALNPVISNLTRSSGQTDAAIRSRAGAANSFGGSRLGLQQGQNNADLLRQIATTSGEAYSTGFDKSLAATQADRARDATAAGTSLSIGGQANTQANDAVSRILSTGTAKNTLANDTVQRLIQSADASGRAGTTLSDLATAGIGRLTAAGTAANQAATTRSSLANDNVARMVQAAGANTAAGKGQSEISTDALNRFLALIQPSTALADSNRTLGSTESALTNDAINRLETTGQVEQDYNQNVDNASYQAYLDQRQDALTKLNALIAAAGNTPYGTSTTSNTQGTQVIQKPSMFGQLAGAAATLGGAAIMASDRDAKTDFAPVDDEDILARFRGVPVETYRYVPEAREAIGDDGRERIGPMAQDWAKHFGGNGKVIPMPEVVGAMFSAIRALDRRTAPQESTGAALRRLAA